MNEIDLYRRISLIHAVKCNETEMTVEAVTSFNRLLDFKNQIASGTDDDLENQINQWMNESPIVSEAEIMKLYNAKKS